MPQKWTGALVGKMHNNRVTQENLAAELHCTKAYVSMVLNGARTPANARKRFEDAYSAVIAKRTDT